MKALITFLFFTSFTLSSQSNSNFNIKEIDSLFSDIQKIKKEIKIAEDILANGACKAQRDLIQKDLNNIDDILIFCKENNISINVIPILNKIDLEIEFLRNLFCIDTTIMYHLDGRLSYSSNLRKKISDRLKKQLEKKMQNQEKLHKK